MEPANRADTSLLLTPRALPQLSLRNARTGAAFGKAQLQGHWTLIYTGYLNCPDLCPTTLSLFAQLNQTLQQRFATSPVSPPRFALLSIDHFRDSAKDIDRYTQAFDSAIIPLTGTPHALAITTAGLGFIPPPKAARTNVAHSSAIALIGPNTELRALFRHPHDQEQILATLIGLISQNTQQPARETS